MTGRSISKVTTLADILGAKQKEPFFEGSLAVSRYELENLANHLGETSSIGSSASGETSEGCEDDFDNRLHDLPDLVDFLSVHGLFFKLF